MPTVAGCAIDISGILKGLGALRQRGMDAAKRSLAQYGADKVLGEAQLMAPIGGGKYSPKDPHRGALKASGTWTEPRETLEGRIVMEVGFNVIYAEVQEVRDDFRHDQGQARYLKTAIAHAKGRIDEYIAKGVREAIGG